MTTDNWNQDRYELDLDVTEMEILMASDRFKGRTASDAVNRAVYIYNLVSELAEYFAPRVEEAPAADAPSAAQEQPPEPRYDPGRPTDDDVAKVRAAMRQIWSTVKYLADETGLEQYVVRRACKEMAKRGEVVWKEVNGGLQFMRTPRAVQATLPEPREPRARFAPRIRAYLDGGAWRTTAQVVKALGLDGDEAGRTRAYNALCRMALEGEIERYPPAMAGRRASASHIEWRIRTEGASE